MKPLDVLCSLLNEKPLMPNGTCTAKSTGFRWASPYPMHACEDPWPDVTTLEHALDVFIDRHLWWAPLPRVARQMQNDTVDPQNVWSACLELTSRLLPDIDVVNQCGPFSGSDIRLLTTGDKIFKTHAPVIHIMRQTFVDVTMMALLCVILAIDVQYAKRIDMKFVQNLNKWAWTPEAFNLCRGNIAPLMLLSPLGTVNAHVGESVSAACWRAVLQEADKHLQKRSMDNLVALLPVALDDWLRVEDNMLPLPLNIQKQLDTKLNEYAEGLGLKFSTLRQWLYIKDYAEEDIQIGFKPTVTEH